MNLSVVGLGACLMTFLNFGLVEAACTFQRIYVIVSGVGIRSPG